MSQHTPPIVPHILFIPDQRHPWKLAQLHRHSLTYHTPTMVRTRESGTLTQTHVYCLPDDAAWERVQATQAALQLSLDALAGELRQLGSYAKGLEAAGGFKHAPNPLCPTVIGAPDPDLTDDGSYFNLLVPRLERRPITRHTLKMLRAPSRDGSYEYATTQRDHFVCPDDADWDRVEQARAAAQAAADRWEQLLETLGTYQAALGDGRYAKPAAAEEAQPPMPNWPQVSSPLIYGHHRNASSGGVTHIWRPAPTPRSKQRHETLCHIVMTEPPHLLLATQPGRLCTDCRRAAEQLATKQQEPTVETLAKTRLPWPELPPALSGWRWSTNAKTHHHFLMHPSGGHIFTTRHYPDHMDAIYEAQRWVLSQPKQALAVVEPAAAAGVPMMDQAEARETIDNLKADLGQVDLSLSDFRRRALDFAEREGWKALGYAGALEAINAELGASYSKSYLSRLLGAARIERILELPMGNSVPERVLREVGQLDSPDQQRAAWQAATQATSGKPTAKAVQQAAQEIAPKEPSDDRPYSLEQAFPLALRKRAQRLGVQIAGSFDITRQQAAIWLPGENTSRWTSAMELAAWCDASEKPTSSEDAPAQPLPDLPADLIARASRAGLNVWIDRERGYRSANASGAAHYTYHATIDDLIAFIARRETPAPAQLPAHLTTCIRCGAERSEHRLLTSYEAGLVPEYGGRAVTLCSRCIPELLSARAKVAAPAAPGVLTRPQRPRSADVSVQLAYIDQLEAYATTLEQRIADLERRLSAPLTFIRSQLATCELRLATGTADVITGAELLTLATDLDQLTDDESTDTAVWDALSARIGTAQRRLAQLTESEGIA